METTSLRLTACRHCGQSFAPRAATEQFCCSGCETVFGILQRQGLGDYYRIRDLNPPACPLPVQPTSETFDFCDDPTFIEKMSPDGERLIFFLEGLNCTACLWLLEKLPNFCPAAESAQVNMSSSTIEVTRVPGGSFAAVARTLNSFGYRPHPVQGKESATELQKRENRKDMIRIGLAAGATGNIMILAVSIYGGAEGALATQFRWVSALLAAPVLTYCSWPFYKSAWNALRTRHLNIDLPIVAALVAGLIFSAWGLIEDKETVYFDSLSMLVFLLLSSRFWLKRIQQHHLDVSHLEDYLLMGSVDRVTPTGDLERVSSLSLKKDDVIELKGEGVVPADGTVVLGSGLIQTAVLTGESAPFSIRQGDRVEAGSGSLSGIWRLRVTNPAAESRLAQILKDAERSTKEKPQLVLFADKVGQWFIGIVFSLAFVLAGWFATTDPREGFARALALIIVTCPCVFGMAIPLSMSLAIRGAARRGMILKNGDVIERLSKIRTVVFDKTGTLTKGDLRVIEFDGEREALAAALALEAEQPHPVARAIRLALAEEKLPTVAATRVRLLPEGGIQGWVNGTAYSIRPLGSRTESAHVPAPIGEFAQLNARYGVFKENDPSHQVLAQFEIGDQVRDEAREVVAWARANGMKPMILSGDRPEIVNVCGAQLRIESGDLIANATPERKSSLLKALGSESMMVGDGANDAAALASASVGIAVRGSMDVSLRAADVYLTRSDLTALPALFEIARLTRRAIARNLLFSASFNVVSGGLAIAGLMSPLWAAILMPLSSLTVLASALWTGKRIERESE